MLLDTSKIQPPFYQFGDIGMIICQERYDLDTAGLTITRSVVPDYPNPCDPAALPDDQQAQQILLDRLKQDHFDITNLEVALKK